MLYAIAENASSISAGIPLLLIYKYYEKRNSVLIYVAGKQFHLYNDLLPSIVKILFQNLVKHINS